jgi:dTDP-4-dehydrorhamnose reductase
VALSVLLAGCKGQLGSELRSLAPADIDLHGYDLPEIDITDAASVAAASEATQPNFVVNAAAYTAVDKAESDANTAYAVNATGAGLLASAAARHSAPIIHISTDFVFPGDTREPLSEDAPIGPLGVYGATKAAGEQAVREATDAHIIIRTAWLYSSYGHNFVKTMLRLARERDSLGVVDDQVGSPTYARDLAAAILHIIAGIQSGNPARGTYHFSNAGHCSWHGFACHAIDWARPGGDIRVGQVDAIPTSAYPTPAARPAWSVMDCSKIGRDFDIVPRPWQEALDDMLSRL